MSTELFISGYRTNFLNAAVNLPTLNSKQSEDLAPVDGRPDNVAEYINYSLQVSASRGFPYYTASNIDGVNFKKAPRRDAWRTDQRISREHQWGPELYRADKSDFDKGHMTKREDVQWGDSIAIASKAADATFFYTNAVPQHAQLNQQIWRSLEDYVLHTEARQHDLLISVFTGPVLSKKDPWFVTPVKNRRLQLPILFWKIIYFTRKDGSLYRVGFLMSQSSLLFSEGIVETAITEKARGEETEEDQLFMEFEEADTYQVNIGTIETLSGLQFAKASEPFEDSRSIRLVLKEIDIKESIKESNNAYEQIGFRIEGLQI
ncbi:MAG: DNA/RNA non-specific endonuclease [Candidatus Pseudobacter hemicellulosilyticus]|uniref:DNA/RNA non-specific endonuclease n=1 Tax=Candidatus Pseudobacter hemicellulosilyticus TaxID=3121375 RepID=A0AAJ5WM71_9BACT|nr:MAG: DNA/RNA non-specific endonuclease [Pseudobacter sp.]